MASHGPWIAVALIEPRPLEAATSPRASETIQRILATARTYLAMEVALVSEFFGGRSVIRFLDADLDEKTVLPDRNGRLLESYCYRVVQGQFPEVIPDTRQFPPARGLGVTAELSIGSYVGVPIVLSDGQVYGILCCFSSQPDPSRGELRLEVVRLLSHLIAETLEGEESRWRRDQELRGAMQQLVDGGPLHLDFQPIVDLQRGTVVGYEALSRFAGPPDLRAEEWFLEADRLGFGASLEARVIETALARGQSRPANTFLSINVSPGQLRSPEVLEALRVSDLAGVVLEITEHQVVSDYESLRESLATLRERGVRVAVDDAGAGYAGLQQILAIRPDFIKLDRALVHGVDRDEAKLVLAEALGTFAGRVDAWVIAEGIETTAELDALVRLQVPLGQGWELGGAGPPWLAPEEALLSRVRVRASGRAAAGLTVASLIEDAPTARDGLVPDEVAHRYSLDPDLDVVVIVGATGEPRGFLSRALIERGGTNLRAGLRVKPTSPVDEVARRATTRPVGERFDPLLCVDDRGRYVGVVRFERLVEALTGTEVVTSPR